MRYFIGTDISGHKYLVPVEKYREWNEWYETWLTALDDDYPDLDEELEPLHLKILKLKVYYNDRT